MGTVLVTGATGFIGEHVARVLVEAGHEVRCLVRSTSNSGALSALGVRLVQGDLSDPASLAPAIEGVAAIHHLASLLKVPWKPEFRSVNIGGTEALARAAAERETPPVLVVVSSLAAAGPAIGDRPRNEEDPPLPVSRYGRMKLDSERAAAKFAARAPITIVRPPMVIGEGDRWGLALFKTAERGLHLVPTWADHRVALVHATDLARLLIAAAGRGERLENKPDPEGPRGRGVYYAADPIAPTYAELGLMIARAMGKQRPVLVRMPTMASGAFAAVSELWARHKDRPTILNLDKWREATAGSWICDSTKARRDLGFAPEPLETRLLQTVEWYRVHGWIESR